MKLNIGCGKDIRVGYVNADIVKLPGVDRVVDFDSFPYPFKDNTFDEILCSHVLEHLTDLPRVMEELHRIAKPNARIIVWGPFYNHHTAFQDPTHKHFFALDTFDYFESHNLNYYSSARFRIVKKKPIPSPFGRVIISDRLLNFFGMIFGELVEQVYFELRVDKERRKQRSLTPSVIG